MRHVLLRPLAAAALALALVATAGCLKTDAKTVLEKDGSGTISRTVVIDLKAMEKIAEMFKSMMPSGGQPGGEAAPKEETPDPAEIARKMKEAASKIEGVTLTKMESSQKDGKIEIVMEATFKSLELLGRSGLLMNEAMELSKNADGSYTLKMDPLSGKGDMLAPPSGDAGMGGDDPTGGMGAMLQAILPMIEEFMGGFEVRQSLVLPGAVTETNGTKSDDGKSVTWTTTWKDLTAGKGVRAASFKAEGVDLKPFKFEPNPQKMQDLLQGKKADGEKPADAPK